MNGRRSWVLGGFVVACLAAAAWLFWSDVGADEPDPSATRTTEDRELAEGLLDVPEEDDAPADDHRGDPGRDRLEAGTGGDDSDIDEPGDDDEDETSGDDEPLPAIFQNLQGRRIAVYEASAVQEAGGGRLVRVGGLRVPCSSQSDPRRAELERIQVLAVLDVLDRAGARALSLDVEDGRPGCIDQRVRTLDGAELALVIRAGTTRRGVHAGRPAADASRASRRASTAFAAELAAALDMKPPGAPGAGTSKLLAEVGAIDLDGGAAVAFVEYPLGGRGLDTDQAAFAIARALALTAARAR